MVVRQVMERPVSHCLNSLTAFLHAAACIVSIAMLLSFPAVTVHNFATHFRAPEVRRTAERHTSVVNSDEDNTRERVAQRDLLPTFFVPTEPKTVPGDNLKLPSQVPLSRLLNRLKLSCRASRGQDPFLEA